MDPLAVKTMMMTLKGLRNPWFPFTRKKHISELDHGDVVVYDEELYLVTDIECIVINKIKGFKISKLKYLNEIVIRFDSITSSETFYDVLICNNKIRELLKLIYRGLEYAVCVKSTTKMYIYLNSTKHGCNLLQYSGYNTIKLIPDFRYNNSSDLQQVKDVPQYINEYVVGVKIRLELMFMYLGYDVYDIKI